MNANQILDMIGDAKGTYIWDARQPRRDRSTTRKQQPSGKRLWLIAAVVALMLLLVGCVAYVLSLRDMALGKEDRTYYDGSSQTVTLFSLQGVKGTPAYQASKEWHDWLQTYDTDGSVRFSDEAFSEDFGDEYYAYSLYSREMKDKLDEICAKYGLSLLGKMYVDPDVEAGCQALQIQGILRPGAQAETDWGSIRYYANGSYDLEGHITLTAPDTPWPYEREIVSFSCMRKDAFSELLGSVGPEGTYDEWTYTNADGVELLMVIDHSGVMENSLILADQGPYTFLFSIPDLDGQHPMTKEGLEAYAEVFDFTAQPQPVTQADLQAADQRREQADQDFAEEQDKMAHSFSHMGYEDWIKFQLAYALHPDQLGFAVLDLEGNGSEDLLVGENGYIRAVYTTRDDGTQHIMPLRIGYVNSQTLGADKGIGAGDYMFHTYIYLCEGNSLAYVYDLEGDGMAYHFATVKDGELVWTDLVSYQPDNPYFAGNPWEKYDELRSHSEPITEEEFNRIVHSYKRVILDMHPISQYPLTDDSPSGIGRPPETYNRYDDMVHSRTGLDPALDRSGWAFCLTDLDEDGQQELLWKEDSWVGVFTMQGGQVKQLAGGENLTLCQGGIIAQTITYLDGNQTCCYYQVKNGDAVLVDYLRYDADKNPDNPWLQSADRSGQDYSMQPISQAEFDAIRTKYTPTEPNWQPVSAYPN